MKILLLNPNTSKSVTELMMTAGQEVASPGTELVPSTASRGVPYIASRAEAQIGGRSRSICSPSAITKSMRRSSPPSAIPGCSVRASSSTFR